MSELFVMFLTPEAALFVMICAYIYGLYWSISQIVELNKKQSLTEEEKKTKNNAITLLSCFIGIPIVVYILYKIFSK